MRTFLSSTFSASIILLLCISCEGDSGLPTAPPPQLSPPPPAGTKGFVWGHVLGSDTGGVCLLGSVVEIVEGPGAGQKSVQKEACSVWDEPGYEFGDLPLGVPIKLRATREGYHPEERKVFASTGGYGIDIVLRKK